MRKLSPSLSEHHVVYRNPEYFCAWPFNGGFWRFADGELAVGFVRGKCDYARKETVGHREVDVDKGEHVIVRSRDGGRTWPVETMTTVYQRPAWDKATFHAPAYPRPDHAFDPSKDGHCLICGYGIPPQEGPDRAFVVVSTDRGHTWSQPTRLPPCGFASLGGRPSYIQRPDGMLLLFCHGSRAAAPTADPKAAAASEASALPLVYGSWDGGISWGLIAEMELSPARPMGIMPYPLLLPSGRILAAVRRQYNGYNAFTQVYASDDGGLSWRFLSRVNEWGAPANLVLLPSGEIVCVYGYRQRPWGIRARVSANGGASWGPEITVRDDGGSWDLGYPRTVANADGGLTTVYYFNDATDPVQCEGGVRHIACTIWKL